MGDTIYDVRAALDAGVIPVAVATGHASTQELLDAGAVVVLGDLTNTPAALEAIHGH